MAGCALYLVRLHAQMEPMLKRALSRADCHSTPAASHTDFIIAGLERFC